MKLTNEPIKIRGEALALDTRLHELMRDFPKFTMVPRKNRHATRYEFNHQRSWQVEMEVLKEHEILEVQIAVSPNGNLRLIEAILDLLRKAYGVNLGFELVHILATVPMQAALARRKIDNTEGNTAKDPDAKKELANKRRISAQALASLEERLPPSTRRKARSEMSVTTQMRADVFKTIKDANPDLTYEGVAERAQKVLLDSSISGYTVKDVYGRVMGWPWKRGKKTR